MTSRHQACEAPIEFGYFGNDMTTRELHLEDPYRAMVGDTEITIGGQSKGPLAGRRFVVKDLFDVAGSPTLAGSPDWNRQRPHPDRHAAAVEKLLDAGAKLIGKTITDEISLGILGENVFDGTPQNPACPGRVPGGSSAGSAAAVAGRYCDFALGSDTGGSVRVPASFCGIYGIRPTHGRVATGGMLPQAPSSDTAGWFAREAGVLGEVGSVLLEETIPDSQPETLLIARDAFAFADESVQIALQPLIDRLGTLFRDVKEIDMALDGLVSWSKAQRTIQPAEGWQSFSDWIDNHNPRMSYTVARNLFIASQTSQGDLSWAQLVRRQARARMKTLLEPGAVLCMPTTPFCAPLTGLPVSQTDELRMRISVLCCHGGLTGVPQVSIPGTTIGEDNAPIGLSIVAGHHRDSELLAVAAALEVIS